MLAQVSYDRHAAWVWAKMSSSFPSLFLPDSEDPAENHVPRCADRLVLEPLHVQGRNSRRATSLCGCAQALHWAHAPVFCLARTCGFNPFLSPRSIRSCPPARRLDRLPLQRGHQQLAPCSAGASPPDYEDPVEDRNRRRADSGVSAAGTINAQNHVLVHKRFTGYTHLLLPVCRPVRL